MKNLWLVRRIIDHSNITVHAYWGIVKNWRARKRERTWPWIQFCATLAWHKISATAIVSIKIWKKRQSCRRNKSLVDDASVVKRVEQHCFHFGLWYDSLRVVAETEQVAWCFALCRSRPSISRNLFPYVLGTFCRGSNEWFFFHHFHPTRSIWTTRKRKLCYSCYILLRTLKPASG